MSEKRHTQPRLLVVLPESQQARALISYPGDRVAKKRKGCFEAEVEEYLAEGYKREVPCCAHSTAVLGS